jgi:sugar lactone lactonase YvrE
MPSQRLEGVVQSGSQGSAVPVRDALVTLYVATEDAPLIVASTRTDDDGRFEIYTLGPTTASIFYATAHQGVELKLAAVIGGRMASPIVINELTTVAAGYAAAQFIRGSRIEGNAFGLRIAAGMAGNLVSVSTGEPSEVMLKSPNADETNALRSLRALANLLAACVRDVPGARAALERLAPSADGVRAADTFQAVANIALNPARNVEEIYRQTKELEVYLPALEHQPDAWTLAVKVNDSGDDEFLFGGPANIAFDRNGYAWVANNVVQGTPGSARCIMVLQPDGRPADGRDGAPLSPVSGGGILGVGFGVTVAPDGNAWVGNFGWGDPDTDYPKHGTVSRIDPQGRATSPEGGFHGGTDRVQATVADQDGNIWLASFGNDRVVVFPGGDPEKAFGYPPLGPAHLDPAPGVGTFGIAIAADGSAWVSYSGGLGWPLEMQAQSCVCRYRIDGGTLRLERTLPLGSVTKGIGVDSEGNAWVASGGDDTVYMVSPDCETYAGFTGGGVNGPWSVAVDGDDHVWVANFGPMGPAHHHPHTALSQLAGIRPPPGLKTGDPISPPSGYTLHSAGDQVLLHDHKPLNGPDGEPCYTPLMRMTSCVIDQAGNVWALNNWKPDFATDFSAKSGNPGGDGIVIFVGMAKPPKPAYAPSA